MEIVYKKKLNSIQLNSLEKLDSVIVRGNKNTSAIPKSIASSVPNLSSMRSSLLFVNLYYNKQYQYFIKYLD